MMDELFFGSKMVPCSWRSNQLGRAEHEIGRGAGKATMCRQDLKLVKEALEGLRNLRIGGIRK
jgi:hypothetical protein